MPRSALEPDARGGELLSRTAPLGPWAGQGQVVPAAPPAHGLGHTPHGPPPPPPAARSSFAAEREPARREPVVGLHPSEEDELDIPTFLRRKAD